jgi:hypothetical protein
LLGAFAINWMQRGGQFDSKIHSRKSIPRSRYPSATIRER